MILFYDEDVYRILFMHRQECTRCTRQSANTSDLPLEIFQWHVTVRTYSRASCRCQDTNGSVYLVLYTFMCAKKTSRSAPGRCFPSRITRSVGISANREITRACLAERRTIPLNRPSLLFPLSACRGSSALPHQTFPRGIHVILIHLLFLSA